MQLGGRAARILLLQWSNDLDTQPSIALSKEHRPGGPVRTAIVYPPVGSSREDGHDGLYLAVPDWEPDLFRFLDEAIPP